MKKLMVMLTAAATALGLYAADPIDSTSFESGDDFAAGVLVTGTGTKWSCTDTEAKLLQGVYDTEKDPSYAYNETDNVRYGVFGDDQANYLSVKTTFGKPLVRAIGATTVGDDALFFDQLVKFTATDEDPTTDYESYADAKIIVYAQNMTPDEQTEVNHLMVKAGRYAGGELTADTYDLGAIDLAAWHRLTIKANKVSGTLIGFQIFVDGVAKAFTGKDPAFDAAAAAGFAASLKSLNTYKKLFPSLVTGTTLNDVCFDGQGSIDDLIATTEPAGKWAEDATITLNWDATQLTALTYAYGEVPATAVDDITTGVQVIPYIDGETVITLAPTYVEGFGNGVITGDEKVSVDGLTFKASADGAVATFTAKDTTPRVYVTIGSGEPVAYPTFAEALAAINDQQDDAAIALNEDLTLTDVTDGVITAAGDVEIDLAGHTLTGPDNAASEAAVIMAVSNLKIVDTVGTGAVVPGENSANAVIVGGNLIVTGGTFEGVVSATTSEVSGGAFKIGDQQEFPLTVAPGYTVSDEVEGYWTVIEAPKATVTVTATKVTVDGVETGDKFVEDAVIEFTVTPDQYYAIDTVTVNGEKAEGDDSTYTYTVKAEDIEGGIAIVATAAAKQYTIKYLDENEEEIAGVDAQYTKFTVETKSMDLYVYETEPLDGYDFSGWTLDGESFTATSFEDLDFDEVDVADGIELAAAFDKAHEYTITYDGNGADSGEVASQKITIESTDVLVAENAFVKANAEFTGWNTQADGEGTSYAAGETITIDEPGDVTLYAQWEQSAGPEIPDVIKEGSEEQQKAYQEWAAKYPDATIDPADPLTVDRFALGLAPDATKEAIQQKVEDEVPQIDMAALVAGDLTTAVAKIAEKYPNATVILAPTTIEGADTENAKFYQLKISFVPANIGQ